MERVNFVAYACGMRRGGKTTWLNKYASRFPRRLIVDLVGEVLGTLPGATDCLTLSETTDALGDLAKEPSWIVVTSLTPDDTVKLLHAITPAENPRGGYSLAVDGMTFECGELDTVMPNHKGISDHALAITTRGRHYRCSLLGASLRAADVHKSVTSQPDVMAFFKQHEPNDIDYIAKTAGEHIAARVSVLEPFAHVLYMPRSGRASAVDADGISVSFDRFTGRNL